MFKPQPTNPVIQLTYTTYSLYGSTYQGGAFGFVAFGTPTPASGVPISGTASYERDGGRGDARSGRFHQGRRNASIQFRRGHFNGHFDPVIYDLLAFGPGGLSLGRYDFTNTVYSSGSTSFSGGLTRAGVTGAGTFEGQFSGPNAQELMARWTAPFVDPRFNVTSDMFGVWVGKR